MQLALADLRREFRPMLRLAGAAGGGGAGLDGHGDRRHHHGRAAGTRRRSAPAASANMLFYPIAICGTGMLLGMDTLVAQSFGADDAARLPPHPGERRVAGRWR